MKESGTGSLVLGDISDVSTLGLQPQAPDDEDENVEPGEAEISAKEDQRDTMGPSIMDNMEISMVLLLPPEF
ncbi:plasma membrane ATPase 1-like [Pyrus ussuriensis x Pyrus communis]|uniref:Plasma membrane ATPase 1-like n=1 Tax=Pyrus ussuriensis x Pyrus communis TaxID=2448454 RepID=A0A5N5HI01_9ROSA|nr:plasma membrane ATPase 1-like [Pyrus ussuriensis x Pyrus communis]